MTKIGIACPRCLKIDYEGREWDEEWAEYHTYSIQIVDGDIEKDTVDVEGADFIEARHECGFVCESHTVEDFLVKVENGEIVDVGDFWIGEPDKLKELAEKNSLRISKKVLEKIEEHKKRFVVIGG